MLSSGDRELVLSVSKSQRKHHSRQRILSSGMLSSGMLSNGMLSNGMLSSGEREQTKQ